MPYVWTWVAEDNKTAVALLERALELDPSYARASSLLVWAYGARAQLGWSEPSEMLDEALAKARQAIEQDWDDPWAHMAAGYVHMVSRRFKNAVEELTEAIDRNPNFAFAHMLLSSTYAYGGMIDDGLRHVSISMRLSKRATTKQPISRSPAYATLLAKRFSEAVVFERRAVQLWPHFTTARRTLAAAAGLAGELDVAAEALAAAKRLQLNMSLDWIEKYHPIVHTEDRALYIEGLRRAGLT